MKGCPIIILLPSLIEISFHNANSVDPVQTRILRRLIWVYTVCKGPNYGMLGINGLKHNLEIVADDIPKYKF